MSEQYKALLRDPRWQRKRLEVMQRANFRCEECGNPNLTLHVHHLEYRSGAKPWEYPDHKLQCICEPCHQLEHGLIDYYEWESAIERSVPCPSFEELTQWLAAGRAEVERKAEQKRKGEALIRALGDMLRKYGLGEFNDTAGH